MRASTGQVQEALLEVVEGARSDAVGRIARSAERASDTVNQSAAAIAVGLDHVVERAPTIDVEVRRRRRRTRPILIVVVAVAVLAVAVRLAFRRSRGDQGSGPADRPEVDDAVDDAIEDAVGVGNGTRSFAVVPADAGGWDIQGPTGVVGHSGTQAAAIEEAAKLARDGGGEVVIHGRDGKPRDTRRYDND